MLRTAALAIALLACGSKREPQTHHVEIRGMDYVPAELTVNVGDTIVWTNHDVLPHTVTSAIPAPTAFDSREIASKQQWQLTVSAAGEYSYVCTYHPTMRARLSAR